MNNLDHIKKEFNKNGFFIVKNLFEKKKLLKVKKNLNKNYNIKDYNIHYNPHEKNYLVKKILSHIYLTKIIKNIFECKTIYGLQSAYFCTSKNSSGVAPHQDDFFLKSGFNNTINIWIPLLNIKKKNGAMTFYLESHKNDVDKKTNLLCLDGYESKSKLKKNSKKIAECKLGDVVLIHNHMFHKGGKNTANKIREVLSCSYIKNKKKFRVGNKKNRKKFKLVT